MLRSGSRKTQRWCTGSPAAAIHLIVYSDFFEKALTEHHREFIELTKLGQMCIAEAASFPLPTQVCPLHYYTTPNPLLALSEYPAEHSKRF